jgi:hypothetical protein
MRSPLSTKKIRTRYRIEEGRWCIDINVRNARQLFDGRDPAPFHERDLDEKAASYILASVQEIPRKQPFKIVLSLADVPEAELSPIVLEDALHAHFNHELEQTDRIIREHVRRAQLFLVIGLSVLVIFLGLAEMTLSLPESTFSKILREGLFITGWVAMWRPLEALLYDWWPHVDRRRLIRRVLTAEVSVRSAQEPVPS